jgi:hypothetical protein
MSFIVDFKNAIDKYDGDFMDVMLVGYERFMSKPTDSKLNPGEWFRFQIQVHNKGELDLTNVSVRVEGTPFAKVSLSKSDPVQSVVVKFGDMRAHSSLQSGAWVYGYATLETSGIERSLVIARIDRWNASLDHILKDHSGWGPREGRIKAEVHPG